MVVGRNVRKPFKKGAFPKRPFKKKIIKRSICLKMEKDGHCLHEKCNHLKLIKTLWFYKEKFHINFFPSLLPYHRIKHQRAYGVISGLPDFFIEAPKVDKNGKIVSTGLYIELKVGKNRVSQVQKREIKKIIRNKNCVVGVCYGVQACRDLIKCYLNKKTTMEDVEKLCWKGLITKEYITGGDESVETEEEIKEAVKKEITKPVIIDVDEESD